MIDLDDMKLARHRLRMNVTEQVGDDAVDYIDWDAFESVLEAVLMTPNPTNEMMDRVFKASITKAQLAYIRDKTMKPTN